MHQKFLYAAYGWLLLSGILQFLIDVVSQYVRGKRAPGLETTLYYGLNTAYALGQILFALLALLVMRDNGLLLGRWPALTVGFAAGCGWLVIGFVFLEYREPRFTMGSKARVQFRDPRQGAAAALRRYLKDGVVWGVSPSRNTPAR